MNLKSIIYFKCLYFTLLPLLIHAQAIEPIFPKSVPSHSIGFTENKGQIINQNNELNPEVQYLLCTPGFNVQLRKGGFSYDIYTAIPSNSGKTTNPVFPSIDPASTEINQRESAITRFVERIDFDLIGSNRNCKIIAVEPSKEYYNYYTTGTPVEGIREVRYYGQIIYQDIYPGIDLEFFLDDSHKFKYTLVLHPGSRCEDIKIRIHGAKPAEQEDGSLMLNTGTNRVIETIPESYFIINERKQPIQIRFRIIDRDIYGFSISGIYPANSTVYIDPVPDRVWGTYFGGNNNDLANDCRIDPNTRIIMIGSTQSTNNIATTGAYQINLAGNVDVFISKFNDTGQLLWGTYFGGPDADEGYQFTTDNSGNIYITGITGSLTNIATPGSYQLTNHGYWDGFLAKFNPSGFRIWGTYYGGEMFDNGSYCELDREGHIYLIGSTESQNFISSPGSFQAINGGGLSDGFIAKFDTNGKQRIWGTYFGGNHSDAFASCSLDTLGHLVLSGSTRSSNAIASPGAYQTTLNGNRNGILCLFDTAGQRIWSTYYGGSQWDGFAVAQIRDGYIYGCGGTMSPDNIASPGAYQEIFGGIEDAFLIKFTLNDTRVWGTYFGGALAEQLGSRSCLTVTKHGIMYFAGSTQSTNSIATTGAYQTSYGGGTWDAFLTRFDTSGTLTWSTYYGDVGFDGGSAAAVDTNGYCYLSGSTSSQSNISTTGTHQSVYGGDPGDGFLVKFSECTHPDAATQIQGISSVCKPSSGILYTVAPIPNALSYHWHLPPGVNITNGMGTNSITVDFTASAVSGLASVRGYNSCGTGDSSYLMVTIQQSNPIDISISGSANPVCAGTEVTFTATPVNPGSSPMYQWTVNGVNAGTNSTTYSYSPLNGDIVGCVLSSSLMTCVTNNPATSNSVVMTVNPLAPVSISINTPINTVCAGTSVTFTASPGNPGSLPVYQWKVNGVNVGANSDTYSYVPLNGDNISCILTSSITDCVSNNPATSNSILMTVDASLTVGVSISTATSMVCAGTSVTFNATPVNPGLSPVYQWKVNGINVGTNALSYSYVPLNGDVVSCLLTSSLTTCVTSNPATSNLVTMTVNPLLQVNVSIDASAASICSGTLVTFTATPINEGSLPVFQWKRNGENTGTNSQTYIYAPTNGDIITCTLTSSLTTCVTGNPASSNPVSINVNPLLPVSVSIAASANPVCSGSSVTFNATSLNQGSVPVYQWKVNGVNSGSNSPVYSYMPSNNDQVWCTLTSSETCAINNPASCIPYPVSVKPLPQVTYSSCYDTITTITAQPIKLKGGVPVGGTYSGPGVNSTTGYFNPSAAGVGVKTISYSYQNIYSCSDSKNRTITVQPSPSFTCGGLLTDIRDGKTYPTVLLGNQCWMQKNLDYGSTISAVNHQKDNCIAEKYCYNDISSNCSLYGGLYQWDEVMQFMDVPAQQGLCPAGWHIPTQAEWMVLFNYYQGQGLAGKPMQDSIISGFKALENGVNYSNASWNFKGFASIFWTSTPSGSIKAVSHGMNLINFSVSDYYSNRSNAFGVRCVRD